MATFEELPESRATGEIARIYAELRQFYAAPYVSSLQRHLATWPGLLDYAWAALRPGFASGLVQETAWRLASALDAPPLPRLSPAALRCLGVDAAGERAIRDICRNFVRVSPVNILMGGCLRRILTGEARFGDGSGLPESWAAPAMLPPLPAMAPMDTLDADVRAVLAQFSTDIAGGSFVPGLYRLMAPWPGYLAHVATVLGPYLADPALETKGEALAARIDAAAPDILAQLPAPGGRPAPGPDVVARILPAIATYRRTSPQMVTFGTLLLDALPEG